MGYTDLNDCFQEPVGESREEMDTLCRNQARRYLKEAKEDISKEMGPSFNVSDNPDFVTSYMQLRAQHFNTLFLVKTLQEGFGSLCSEVDSAFEQLKNLLEAQGRV